MLNNIEKIKIKFLKNEPLLGFLIYQIKISYESNIDTLAVFFDDKINKFHMIINKNYFYKLNDKEKLAVIKHELYHIYFKHHLRIKNIEDKVNLKIANIAADIAINQYIDNLPNGALYPETFQLPKLLNFEKYYFLLKEKENASNNIENNFNILDEHIFNNNDTNNLNETKNDEQIKEEIIEHITNKILSEVNEYIENRKNTFKEEFNNIPEELKNILESLKGYKNSRKILINNKKYIDIKKIIKNWIDEIILFNKYKYSWKYNNRRFKELKGKKRIKVKKLVIAIDTSFSITEKEINLFLNTVFNNDLFFNKVILYFFHTKVYYIKEIKKKSDFINSLKYIEEGGTDIQTVFNKIKENKINNLIILTDGFTNYPLKTFNINTLWINHNLFNNNYNDDDNNNFLLYKIIKTNILKKNPFIIYKN